MAEAILATLIEISPRVLAAPPDYEARATLMWSATMALNGLISRGVPTDWSTHGIGHELTVLHGLDHAQTLAIVLPAVLRHQREPKRAKLLQYGARIWGIDEGGEETRIERTIARTEEFFRSLGVKIRLEEYGIDPTLAQKEIPARLARRGARLGERQTLGPREVGEILTCV